MQRKWKVLLVTLILTTIGGSVFFYQYLNEFNSTDNLGGEYDTEVTVCESLKENGLCYSPFRDG